MKVSNNLGTTDIGNVQFVTNTIGFCSTLNHVYKTTNAGSTWSTIRTATTDVTSQTVHFINEDIGFILDGYINTGSLLKTINGGVNWTTVTSVDFGAYTGIEVCSEEEVWLYGDHLTKISTCNSSVFYLDADNDGYGDSGIFTQACQAPIGYVNNNTDCDDTDPNINSGGIEACDELDNNCNGEIDEDDACLGNCQDSWTITNSMTSVSLYEAVNQIKTSNTVIVESSQELRLLADYIDINDGFNMQPGAFFEAIIDPCSLDGNLTTHPEEEIEATVRTKSQIDTTDKIDFNAIEKIPCNNTLSVNPNPFNGTATIGYTLQEASPTRIAIFDLNGKLIKEIKPTAWEEGGVHALSLEANGITKGVYICALFTTKCLVQQTIVVQ